MCFYLQHAAFLALLPLVRQRIIDGFNEKARDVLQREFDFFDKVTSISGALYPLHKEDRRAGIQRELEKIEMQVDDLYLPTAPNKIVKGIQIDSGIPLQSAAKVSIMITFNVADRDGDQNDIKPQACIFKVGEDCREDVLAVQVISLLKDIFGAVGLNLYLYPYGVLPTGPERGIIEPPDQPRPPHPPDQPPTTLNPLAIDFFPPLTCVPQNITQQHLLPTTSLTNPSNRSTYLGSQSTNARNAYISLELDEQLGEQATKDGTLLFGLNPKLSERCEKERKYEGGQFYVKGTEGNEQVSKHRDDVDFEGAAYKDCEEDILMDNSSDDRNHPSLMMTSPGDLGNWSTPWRISETDEIKNLVDTHGCLTNHCFREENQVVPNSLSRSQMGDGGLYDIFQQKYGPVGSPGFEVVRENFIKSSAGYAVASLLLQPKDRHNGNILIDSAGRLVHIDFGFILENCPGVNMRSESAHFKLSHEMTQLIDPSGAMKSETWYQFVSLCVKGYLAARCYMDGIINTILMVLDSRSPCFSRDNPIGNLRKRFHPEMSEREAANYMVRVCSDAYKWTTAGYGSIQYVQQDIEK
ncbi:phosphatidylinositol 4-kinase alpha 1 [Nicotiana attenuata]|uniref:1-phosphatidylinositol 4-kinase n=1 Tax=Nicotiana attenuata TaxID=49451 RepID=A0A1J6IPF2_NICAT|nr:phosphatidylinositol 4-kinase alpha 1 [Nicotiana attenuata]